MRKKQPGEKNPDEDRPRGPRARLDFCVVQGGLAIDQSFWDKNGKRISLEDMLTSADQPRDLDNSHGAAMAAMALLGEHWDNTTLILEDAGLAEKFNKARRARRRRMDKLRKKKARTIRTGKRTMKKTLATGKDQAK